MLKHERTMLKSSRASLLRSSSTRVRGDSRGTISIPNFGSYNDKIIRKHIKVKNQDDASG